VSLEIQAVKTLLVRFQMGTGWARGFIAKNQPSFCPSPKTSWELGFRYDGLINLGEEFSKWPNIQAVAWLWLAVLSQVYSEKCE
jgi:hypothetical protein